MFHKNIKLAITVLLLATAVWQFTERNIGNGIFLILIALIVILFYFTKYLRAFRDCHIPPWDKVL